MIQPWPLKFRDCDGGVIVADDAGGWFKSSHQFVERLAGGRLTENDDQFLLSSGHAFRNDGDMYQRSFVKRWLARRMPRSRSLDYLIVVPTLRCNLACEYCQVSRAAENAHGYDWDENTTQAVVAFIDRLTSKNVTIEFQGGEPLLRLDLLERVRDFARRRFDEVRFVVCSNFQAVDDSAWGFFESEDTFLSTSIDGPPDVHSRQRTRNAFLTQKTFDNISEFRRRFGNNRLSALPTVDPTDPPDLAELVETYASFGLNSIFLRPVNYQGFARRLMASPTGHSKWASLHSRFIDLLVERNFRTGQVVEEFYFSTALRRVLFPSATGNVDLRNPNPVGRDYLVIDYDGVLYPSDEARMVARTGQIDLAIGTVSDGVDNERLISLNASSLNDMDPDCVHCPYQAFCGTDNVDSISRYGRIDLPRPDTWFCQRHTELFDKVFELLTSADEKVVFSLKAWSGLQTWPTRFSRIIE